MRPLDRPGTRRLRRSSAVLLPVFLPVLLVALGGGGAAAPPRRTETATFGGGCFWSMHAIFERLKGVESVTSGFSGGLPAAPSYEQVCAGATGHAECVQIVFDPAVIPYRDLLRVFFDFHDPTTPDRQGADVGEQYRSLILWRTPEQKAAAEETIATLTRAGAYRAPIVTQVVPFVAFYPAESYHQGYYDRNARGSYCSVVIGPKLAKLRKLYAGRLKPGS
jgi:peptide-methionine (S)-S-oxide reductase